MAVSKREKKRQMNLQTHWPIPSKMKQKIKAISTQSSGESMRTQSFLTEVGVIQNKYLKTKGLMQSSNPYHPIIQGRSNLRNYVAKHT